MYALFQNKIVPHFSCVIKNRNEELLVKFGLHLRSLRKQRGWNQEDLAIKADIPNSQVGRIERGEVNVTLSTLKILADTLGISVSELLRLE